MENVSTEKLEVTSGSSDKVKTSPETKSKSLKATSVLDAFCKTSSLNESSDFIECSFKKRLKCETSKNEILCEICKENLTHLEFLDRERHVNMCIDKQISGDSETKTPISENPFILDCPVCFKEFSSTELRSSHIKKCGKSKGLCLQSIIKALELQERHALERISLGLPAKPIKPVKSNKNSVQKRVIVEPKSVAHSDIQLAKALSLSLTTSAQQQDVKMDAVTLKPPNAHQRPGKKSKTVPSSTPLLVLRTEEERKRLLLDKVSTIVAPVSNLDRGYPPAESSTLIDEPMDGVEKLPLLWYLSSKASGTNNYYIEELIDWIKPSVVAAGAKLCHLSQISGHEIVTQLPCEYAFSIPGDADKALRESDEPILSNNSSSVIECFRSLVASSWMSDVNIHTTCGTIIPAHRLLLAARCPPLKQDYNFCLGNERKNLKWEMVSFDAALQFLNFLYTGNMELEKDMTSDLTYLANKYQVLDLQAFLHSTDNSSSPPELKLDNRTSLMPNLVNISSSQPQLECTYISQEEINENLDIICNCINSSLMPSQPCDSSKCCSQTSKQVVSCEISSKMETSVYNSPESAMQNSLLSKGQTSPVVFDVSDSESDTMDDENVKIITNCSQKSASKQYDAGNFDLCSTESSNSQDSVKFLASSFVAPKHSEKVENCSLSSPSFSKLPVSPSHWNDSAINSSISHKFDDLCSYSNLNLSHSINISCKGISQTSYDTHVANDQEPEDPLVETIESEMEETQIISSVGTEGNINNEYCSSTKIKISDETSISYERNILSTPKSHMWVDYTSPVKNASSAKILFSDSDSDSKLEISILPEMFSSNHCQRDIPLVEGTDLNDPLLDSLLHLKPEEKIFHKSQNKYSTSVERPQTGFDICKNCKISPLKNTCSDISGTSTLNELLSLCSGKKESINAAYSAAEMVPKMLKINDSFKSSLSSPEDFDDPYEYFEQDFVFQENSEGVPVKSPTCSRQITADQKTITPLGPPASICNPKSCLSDSPVTPLPDYKMMVTPDIKQALRKIGVKPLPRRKAIALLSHVYDETHPLVNGEAHAVNHSQIFPQENSKQKIEKPKKRKILDEEMSKPPKKRQNEIDLQAAPQESDDSGSENPDWLGCVPEISFSQFRDDSPTKANKDDIESIKKYIQSNEDLYTHILTYKPLNMADFHQELKNSGVKVSIQKLTDFLDEQCITFTCPRKEEVRKKQTARTQRFRKNMIAKLSQQPS